MRRIDGMPCVETPQSRCRLGVARCDITPPVGIYHRMWGRATHGRAAGVHRPLTATAVVFQAMDASSGARAGESNPAALGQPGSRGDSEQILIAVDHCLLWAREMEALLEAVAREAGVARERLLVVFSHTHAAGLMDTDRRDLPGGELIAPYLESLATKLAESVRAAPAAVCPGTIVYGSGRCMLAANRDFRDEAS